jgi:OTU domain-containing protein 3
MGLKVQNINGDGNCLFRAIADQLEGDQEKHGFYR